ncbi:MAG: Membrane-bound lytic murein transglycosylase B [Rhodanobacteraceae bacterium]|jgi:membrane-bound lytic murein transglycosylase B|nr:MAG: Membrane-bound lytic murein transglycosylase B [Rhodanobacteraceae bacterium]
MTRAHRIGSLSLLLTGLLSLASFAQAVPATAASQSAPPQSANPDQAQLVREVAAATGKSPAELNALLDGAVVKQGIIDAMNRPAESKPWSAYRPIFVNPERIGEGVAFFRQHHALLEQIAQQYGVPPEFIVAIIGVETNYGANTGSYRVLDALVTLGFHYPPRAKYFRGELKTLLELPADKLPGPIPGIYGSYAGAEGLAQFMPSSIRDFAVDADGDGHINLVASLPDAFASIANYFRAHGWQTGQPVAVRAAPSATAAPPPAYQNAMPTTPLEQFTADGYAPTAQEDPSLPANLLTLDGVDGPEYWLTFRNFYVITRYNKSPMYALAVMQLADAIARSVAATPAPQ